MGETGEPLSLINRQAIQIWNMLCNGMGSIDWSGLPFAVEWLGVDDVEGLVEGLMTIKSHRPEREAGQDEDE